MKNLLCVFFLFAGASLVGCGDSGRSGPIMDAEPEAVEYVAPANSREQAKSDAAEEAAAN